MYQRLISLGLPGTDSSLLAISVGMAARYFKLSLSANELYPRQTANALSRDKSTSPFPVDSISMQAIAQASNLDIVSLTRI